MKPISFSLVFSFLVSFQTSKSQVLNGLFGSGSFFDEKATMESLLGGSFSSKLLLDGKFDQPISTSSDLNCKFDPPCRWGPLSNGNGPSWYQGIGNPAPLMWQIATGTTITAESPFAVIPFVFQSDKAQWFTSDPINCQKPNGQVLINLRCT